MTFFRTKHATLQNMRKKVEQEVLPLVRHDFRPLIITYRLKIIQKQKQCRIASKKRKVESNKEDNSLF